MINLPNSKLYSNTVKKAYDKPNVRFKGKNICYNSKDSFFSNKNNDDFYCNYVNNLSDEIKIKELKKPLAPQDLKDFKRGLSDLDKSIIDFNFNEYKSGLPIKYERKNFIEDINKITVKLNNGQKNKILANYGFLIVYDGKKVKMEGFPRLVPKKEILGENISNETIEQIEDKVRLFSEFNKVQVKNDSLNRDLNSIVRVIPEYFAIIGKKQHNIHKYSLDIHMLKTFKNLSSDPEYKKLSDEDKDILKIATLIHDITKMEDVIDKEHQNKSAIAARSIVNRLNLSENDKKRIVELVNSHEWLEYFSKDKNKAQKIVSKVRKNGDENLLKLLTKADLKSVNNYLYYFYYFKFHKASNILLS